MRKVWFQFLLISVLSFFTATAAHSASATWLANPGTGAFYTGANWTPASTPGNNITDDANFGASTIKNMI
jgi:hypothetical protein